jgi:hypothetical protein
MMGAHLRGSHCFTLQISYQERKHIVVTGMLMVLHHTYNLYLYRVTNYV